MAEKLAAGNLYETIKVSCSPGTKFADQFSGIAISSFANGENEKVLKSFAGLAPKVLIRRGEDDANGNPSLFFESDSWTKPDYIWCPAIDGKIYTDSFNTTTSYLYKTGVFIP